MKKIAFFALTLLLASNAFAATRIVNLRTEAMDTPIGLDEARPYFSWQMASDQTGALQRAYRVLVAAGEDKLKAGEYVYDSGMVRTDASLNIPYEGTSLRGSTRYFWKVQVWDQENRLVESEPTWFETGLMEKGWSRAQWIGSQEIGVSKYRTFFDIDYDVQVLPGSNRAVFAYSVKDEKNWITAELNVKDSPKFIIDYSVEGDVRHLSTIDLTGILAEDGKHAPHHIRLQVSTPGYHLKSNLIVHFDGQVLRPTEGVPGGPVRENVSSGNPTQMVITPYPNGEYICDWARLHSIGFRQPRGEKAVFSN
ncbi:MAG: glycoside hydrolase, partial [Bacteroidales bacterium]|nr:glycoside hydrolase [Bacteroidales bacterium]